MIALKEVAMATGIKRFSFCHLTALHKVASSQKALSTDRNLKLKILKSFFLGGGNYVNENVGNDIFFLERIICSIYYWAVIVIQNFVTALAVGLQQW
jgi:hypothetical protein